LLDAEILADVYLAMTGGQSSLILHEFSGDDEFERKSLDANRTPLKVIKANDEELSFHQQRLEVISKAAGGESVWAQIQNTRSN
jgi:DNA polymerase-3 subunit epsilon